MSRLASGALLIVITLGMASLAIFGDLGSKPEQAAVETAPQEVGAQRPPAAQGSPPYSPHISARDHAAVPREPGPNAFRPEQLYRKYKEKAEYGDVNAQYVLATALQECLSLAESEDALEQALSGSSPDLIASAKDRFHRCRSLVSELPEVRREYDRWFRAALNGGHPLLLIRQPNRPAEEQRAMIRRAIQGPYPEAYLYAEAYGAAAQFYRNYAEYRHTVREEAWLSLSCASSYYCDADKELQALHARVHKHEYEEIVATSNSLRRAIQRQAWDDLEF